MIFMANITQELATIQTGVYGKDIRMAIYNALQKLDESTVTGAMRYISEAVTVSTTDEYKLPTNKIAPSSHVNITVQGGAGTSTIVRTDGETLTDILTGNTVDSTMATIRITAQDVIAGIKATGSMGIAVKYYSYNCEDLLQMIGNGSSAFTQTNYQEQMTVSNPMSMTSTTYTIEGSE